MPTPLNLDKQQIQKLRDTADHIVSDLASTLKRYTTVSVERSVLRLFGLDGINAEKIPYPNLVVDHLEPVIGDGVAMYVGNAMLKYGYSLSQMAEKVDSGELNLMQQEFLPKVEIKDFLNEMAREATGRINDMVAQRDAYLEKYPSGEKPWKYVIVATGNIYDDAIQAKNAALRGADIIAVIRSTGQSLLDFIPYGPTTEGFGGTYATQENFRIMRRALDEVMDKTGRYIRLVNYASGLCMPEIVVMGAFERLDMMLNDSMYGILFRDINPVRTFIDQFFSRMIDGVSDIIINTGEDNYLTTSDAIENAHTVLASDFINEAFGLKAGLKPELLGLGHAFEMNPNKEDGFLLELAQAFMMREIFPEAPLKYMPPTKFMSGDIFKGYAMNTLFNLIGVWSQQGIQLLGMLTEAMHTPYMQDRYLGLENAAYVMNNARSINNVFNVKDNSIIKDRAVEVMDKTEEYLEMIREEGLFRAIELGCFADIKRSRHGGKGMDGVVQKSRRYYNPFVPIFAEKLGIEKEIKKWI
ncbi:MAG: lysine 5,6-aminomutase subunit alpha [Myxococcota bacterium]